MNWREDASEKAQADLDSLFNQSALLAQTLLARNGEFYPFGASLGTRGKFYLATPLPEAKQPTSQDVIDELVRDYSERNRSIRACVITTLGVLPDGSDAIKVDLEHKEGTSLSVILPIERADDNGDLEFGNMAAIEGEHRVWAA